ncbi:hypothetical protein TNCV_2913181 [Trichonephila clavipes]|nr:hypothetical protein TNCV_2913181 [Trichonephila clavipes]
MLLSIGNSHPLLYNSGVGKREVTHSVLPTNPIASSPHHHSCLLPTATLVTTTLQPTNQEAPCSPSRPHYDLRQHTLFCDGTEERYAFHVPKNIILLSWRIPSFCFSSEVFVPCTPPLLSLVAPPATHHFYEFPHTERTYSPSRPVVE